MQGARGVEEDRGETAWRGEGEPDLSSMLGGWIPDPEAFEPQAAGEGSPPVFPVRVLFFLSALQVNRDAAEAGMVRRHLPWQKMTLESRAMSMLTCVAFSPAKRMKGRRWVALGGTSSR